MPLLTMSSASQMVSIMCDTPCLQWSSSQICSHTLAASECNQEMAAFLEWYTKFVESPNISKLAMSGLPRGRGRKGGRAKQPERNYHHQTTIHFILG